MKKYVIIVAGGSGSRMESELPKQFLEIGGTPLVMRTFYAFSNLPGTFSFILVLPSTQIHFWKQLCKKHNFLIPHQIIDGGPKRFHSVKSGLKMVPENSLVAIHDGVRPFVSKKVIESCFDMAQRKGSAVPAVQVDESVREVSGALNKSFARNKLRIIQTPQVFQSNAIKQAYNQAYSEIFTDDATVLESIGAQIHLVEGNRDNIKITSPADLAFATSYFED